MTPNLCRIATLSVALSASAVTASAQEWPRFRGPDGSGLGEAKRIPASFTDKDFNWRIDLPGNGHSSPILWGDKIFVTCAAEDPNSGTGLFRRLVCVSATDGKILWTREHLSHTYARHGENSFASPTCTADVHHVYVCWNLPEELTIAAFTHDGQPAWERKLGPYVTQHGGGASPVVFEDLVVMPNDQDQPGFLVALDSLTGKDRWRIPRRGGHFSGSSPCVFRDAAGSPQLIFTMWEQGITSVDPKDGKILWEIPNAFDARTVGSPVAGAGLIFASCGEGPRGHTLSAVKPGVGDGKSAQVAYKVTAQTPYVPTPLVVGDLLFIWSDTGTVTCADAATGEKRWEKRVGGSYFSSPVCADGKIYGISKTGEVICFAATGDEYKELGRSKLPATNRENVDATPAIANGRMIFRTYGQLMSVGK